MKKAITACYSAKIVGSTWIVEKISCNVSYSMEESGPFLWWKVGATQRLNIKLQSKSEPLKVEHWCGQINWTMNHVGRRWMFWDNQCNEVLRQIDKCGSVNDTRHGMTSQDVTIGHTCFPRKGSLRLTNTTVGGGGVFLWWNWFCSKVVITLVLIICAWPSKGVLASWKLEGWMPKGDTNTAAAAQLATI